MPRIDIVLNKLLHSAYDVFDGRLSIETMTEMFTVKKHSQS